MPAHILRGLLREKVENFIPEGALSAARAVEQSERAGLVRIAEFRVIDKVRAHVRWMV